MQRWRIIIDDNKDEEEFDQENESKYDEMKSNEEQGMDDTTDQFDDDADARLEEPTETATEIVQGKGTNAEMTEAQQGNENLATTQEQVVDDAHVTITTVTKKTEVPVTSSSCSSNLASKFLNFSNIPHTDVEIVSPMDGLNLSSSIIKSGRALHFHEPPSARSDRGLKKRKLRKDAEPAIEPKMKDSTSGSSKGTKSQLKSSGKSVQSEEPVFEVDGTQTLTHKIKKGNLGDMKDENAIRLFQKKHCLWKLPKGGVGDYLFDSFQFPSYESRVGKHQRVTIRISSIQNFSNFYKEEFRLTDITTVFYQMEQFGKENSSFHDQGHQQAAKGKEDDEEFGEIYWWHRYSNPMIQPELEGSTQGYPLVSVEVLRSILTDSKVNPTKHGRMTKPCSFPYFIANYFISGIFNDGDGVNDIRAERIAKSANPLALLAAAQPYSDNYYQAPKPQRTNTTSSSTRPSASTRHKGKEIAKPVTPQSESVSEEDRQFGNQRTMTVAGTRETECRKPKRVKDYSYHKEKMMMCKQAEHGVPLQAEQADWLADTDEEIDEQELEAHYSFMAKIQEKDDSNVTPDSSNICNNDNQVDQNAAECVDERAALANLIANLTLDTEENKTILKQLKKANASLTQELEECKTNLDETSRALGEATSCRDSCLIALQNKQNELEKYIAFNDRTIDYDILQTKLNETLGLLARKDIDIKEGLKTKAYEISVVNQKHDELVKRSLLTKSQFEGQLKEKSKVISDLKVKEEKDIDKMIEMDKQLKFLNEIVYTRNQSIQTIHMLAPKCSTYNGRPTFANPRYLKKAQSEKPCLYEIPYDTSDPANRFCPNREDTVTLEKESRSKLNKDTVKPYDYTYQNSLYEIFKPPSKTYLDQLERAKEVRKTMWRKTFVRTKPNIAKNVAFLPDLKAQMQDKNIAISELKKLIEKCKGKSVETQFDKPSVVRQPNAQRIPKPSDTVKSYQLKISRCQNNSQVKFTKKEVEDHHRISSISKNDKSVMRYNDSSNSRTSNVNAVCAECGKCVFNSNHDACVSKYLNDVNARTKKPKVVPISASKPKRKSNKSVATPHKKTVASDTTIQKPKSYFKELYENTNKAWKWWIEKKCPSEYKMTQTTP
ncbi:hypothetical protein Tco_0682061 [Tanacetum coccineum]|uniref:Uncharacterized protein n=1 Tax=Tanacetum coccineum TaxID=301880 RepID=A0ABQ4XRQ5_9ASTR